MEVTPSIFNQRIQNAGKKAILHAQNPRIFSLSIKKKFHQKTLLEVYQTSFPHVDSHFWEEKITSGNLTLDGKQTTPNQRVNAGQISQHTVAAKPEPEVNYMCQLMHTNDNFWVINKPAPLPVHAGGRYQHNTLTQLLKLAFPERSFHLINRLDANTTGIVLVALNKKAAQNLTKQFENRSVTKTYLALVEGEVIPSKFDSSFSISKEKTSAGGRKIDYGKEAFTSFETIQTWPKHTLLKVVPRSGRTNQIRLHLANEKHPIVGDLGYANPSYFESNPLTYPTDSLYLHAWKLKFTDPGTDLKVEFIAPPNKKWQEFLPF